MAASETTRPAPFGAITIYHAVQHVGDTLAHLRAWNDTRLTRKALDRLSDRELADIGLNRSDIDSFRAHR